MGGTRFVGKPFVEGLLANGNELTLFTRGLNSVPRNVEHIAGDRSTKEGLESLRGRSFDVIVDISGRTQKDSQHVVEIVGEPKYRLLSVSSAGVYAPSDE